MHTSNTDPQPLRALPALLTAVLCALALLGITGCQQGSLDALFETYLKRLGNTLGVVVTTPQITALPIPPRSGKLQLELAGDKLNTLDFLALRGCALQATIGKHNSSLGRMAKPSQRLLLELEFLRLAPQCIGKLHEEKRTALADQLAHAEQLKRHQLPALIFNATLGSDEYRAFWRTVRPAGEYPRVADELAVSALNAINSSVERWLEGDFNADNNAFELQLGEVAGGDGGAILKSLVDQSDWLAAADDMLQRRIAKGPLCGPSLRHPAADILPNVVQKYFIEGIQIHSAAINRRFYVLLPPINALEQFLSEAVPPDYREWQMRRDELLSSATVAPRLHVEQLQVIQAPCLSARNLGSTFFGPVPA